MAIKGTRPAQEEAGAYYGNGRIGAAVPQSEDRVTAPVDGVVAVPAANDKDGAAYGIRMRRAAGIEDIAPRTSDGRLLRSATGRTDDRY